MNSFDRVVTNMMSRYGGTSTLIVPADESTGTYDVNTSEYVAPQPNSYAVKTIVLDFPSQSSGTQASPNTLIQAGDKQVYVQPIDKADSALTMPKIRPEKDTIDIGGTMYKIVTCKELNPSNTDAILYELLVRK